jgi:hypothetical protein
MLRDVRLAYAHGLWEKSVPRGAEATAKPKFRVCFILPFKHPQIKEIEKVIEDEMKAKFGAKWAKVLEAAKASKKSCLRDGDDNEGDGFAGNMFIAANAETRPSTFNHDRSPVSKDDGVLYSGCYVNASIDVYAFDNVSKGNSAGLRGVQFLRKGDAFGSGGAADESEFDEISAPAEDESLMG